MNAEDGVGLIAVCVIASLGIVTLVNAYAGSREESGYQYGYIAGYSEGKNGSPSRYEYYSRLPINQDKRP